MNERKNVFQSDDSTKKHADLESITVDSYRKMDLFEREKVRALIARQSSDVHEFSQSFLDSLKAQQHLQCDPKTCSGRHSQNGLNQQENI